MTSQIHQRLLKQHNLSALIISTPSHVAYVTNYHGFSDVEREAYVLITKNESYLFTDARYSEATTRSVRHFTTINKSKDVTFSVFVSEILKNEKNKRIGFEADNLTVAEFILLKKTKLDLISISLRDMRVSKTESEIKLMKKAASIAKKSYEIVIARVKPGMTEKGVVSILENEIRDKGAAPSFPTIVAFGKNASVPHHLAGETKLKENDLILIDFGARYENYCSDCTRTTFIGKPSSEQEKVYETVKQAKLKAVVYLKTKITHHKSVKASDVDKVARDFIVSSGYPTIPHSLGHGIGLEVHEAPSLSPQSKDILTDGMVFSIEPGVYLQGKFGVRIEDLFLIQNHQLVKLT
jgi:Xaa-Pro aminopeptidase